jgi:hypothetical protein
MYFASANSVAFVAQSEGINAAVPLAVLSLPFSSQCGFGEEKVPAQVKKLGGFFALLRDLAH